MENTLKILESVNEFYSQSFNQLVVLTVALLAFVGVILPIIISLYQKRLFRVEHEEIKLSLREEMEKEVESVKSTIKNEYEQKLKELDEKLEREIARAIGGIFHVQGNMDLKAESYLTAFRSFLTASQKHIASEKESNLRRALKQIISECLPKLNKLHLEMDEEAIDSFNELLSSLESNNLNGRYNDDIRALKLRFKQAMSREVKD